MSEARKSAERCLSWVVDRDEAWDRETAIREGQVFATLAVADEIAALRGEVEKLTATQVGRAYLAEGDIKGRVYVTGFESAVKDVRDELETRSESEDRNALDQFQKGRVNGLDEAVDLLDELLAPVESEEK